MQDKKKRDTVSVRCPFFGRMVGCLEIFAGSSIRRY